MQMAYNISPDGLSALMGLQSLRNLELVTYSGGLDNGAFKCALQGCNAFFVVVLPPL